MTNAIEQAKREMYDRFNRAKQLLMSQSETFDRFSIFETFLEKYLELLRQDHEALHETARKRFEDLQVAEAPNVELANKVQCWRDLNSSQCATITKDGKTIDDLIFSLTAMTEERDILRNRQQASDHAYNEQKSLGATLVSNSGENASCAKLDAKTAAILGAIVDCQRIVTDWSLEGLKAKEAMRLIFFAVMSPTINSALYEFENKK